MLVYISSILRGFTRPLEGNDDDDDDNNNNCHPLAPANVFVPCVRCAGTFASGRYVKMCRHISPSKLPVLLGDMDPHLVHGSLDPYTSHLQNGISISLAVLQLTRVPNTQTHRPRYVCYL